MFADESTVPGKQIPVWYYKPAGIDANARVMFVMHGADRRADQYRDAWVGFAKKYKLFVVVPEFAEKDFTIDEYQFGNVTDPRRERWNFWIIEHLFDELRRREGIASEKYYLFGHSAGAQFVHRFMIFMPAPRVRMAFAANAGSYTLPVYANSAFPMALDRARVDEAQLAAAFSRRLVVMLGEEDIDPNSEGLPTSPEAMAQGRNRYERGVHFFRLAQRQAVQQHALLRWKLVSVPRVGHSNGEMAEAALHYLFD
ncbi:MAG TPA: hypothetical protein VJ698_19525 [Noviherbaspirillum sp.]|uniref:hypothetical protein n=1 Tax=Noviherbaspirillum sp. TaxID=1926288 RepID=UPI002B4A2C2E|nr:hypothetical protein [Noviherbaspirillum sp.]HJV87669.1 hypothetical protein [Noviherbaspirillum sp.]